MSKSKNKSQNKTQNKSQNQVVATIQKLITPKDLIVISIITILYAILVFTGLGSKNVPETGMDFYADQTHEIMLDFGDYIGISSLDIFLGNYHDRSVSIFVYDETVPEWVGIGQWKNQQLNTVFNWNTANIYYTTRYLSIVFNDDVARINEIICKSDDNIILPINASDYPALFDEQDLYPEYKTYYTGTMFDEIYHGRTGYELLHGITTYETTHPHLGKILISLGIKMFGMNPFGWRFAPAFLGALMIPVFYLFIKALSMNFFVALITTLIFATDFMHFSLARISTIDICVEFFILLMYYFMFEYLRREKTDSKKALRYLALSGITMGLGIATKFTGIYAGAGLGVIFIIYTIKNTPKEKWAKLFGFCCTFFILIPLTIYTLAFIPVVEYYPSSNIITKMINCTKAMIDYHSNLVATHPYSSTWYQWLINRRPLLTAYNEVADGRTSAIVVMGNPMIAIGILIGLIYTLYLIIKKKDKIALFLLSAYIFQLAPWMLVSRIVFIYHYLPSSIFGMLMIGYSFKQLITQNKNAKIIFAIYLGASIVSFIYFYPVISGSPMTPEYVKNIEWVWLP